MLDRILKSTAKETCFINYVRHISIIYASSNLPWKLLDKSNIAHHRRQWPPRSTKSQRVFSRSAFQGNWSRGTRTTTMVDFTRYRAFHLFIPTTMIIDCHLHQAADVGAACSCGLLSSKTSIRGRHLNCHLS